MQPRFTGWSCSTVRSKTTFSASPWPHLRHLLGAVTLGLGVAASMSACGGGRSGETTASPPVAGGGSSGPVTPPSTTNLPTFDTSAVTAQNTAQGLPEGWHNGAFMQVFVRSYQDSNGDGIGDLKGLIARLDYLKDLGVRGLWLMPIHPSQDGDHGYAVKDYRHVDPAFGTLADLDALIAAAASRGIGVILDYVINHSAAEHPAFINARAAKDNAFRNWYVWQDSAPLNWTVFNGNPWRQDATGWYYAPFWHQMPDWNLRTPVVESWHHDNLRFWLNRGIAGFRFDAVGLLIENGPQAYNIQPDSRAFMQRVNTVLSGYGRRFMVCESPDDSQGFANACGSAFGFDLNGRILGAARGNTQDIEAVRRYFLTAAPGTATFLANHDEFAGNRIWNQLAGDTQAYKLAAATYLLLPGTPFIYYGEEIGMAASATLTGDPKLRTPMSWTGDTARAGFTTGLPYRGLSANVATQNVQSQQSQADSLLNFYKSMIGLRNTRLSIARGGYDKPFVQGSVLGYTRTLGQERTLVLINYGAQPARLTITDLPSAGVLTTLWPQGMPVTSAQAGQAEMEVAARSLRVLDLK